MTKTGRASPTTYRGWADLTISIDWA